MAAEDYHPDIGFGSGVGGGSYRPKLYTCNFCKEQITFSNRKPYNTNGTPHRCKGNGKATEKEPEIPQQATLYAMAAMGAIISAQIQKGGIDHIHHMNFYDVADAAWQAASAMVKGEKNYRHEFGGDL